jgi:hypothetical protein
MTLFGDEFLRLESLIYRPVSTRPDWLKAWRNEANYLLYLASGMSEAEILADFPELTVDDVRACLAFAAERERRLLGSVA